MEIKKISVFALKNSAIQVNSAVVFNGSVAIVDSIESDGVILWTGKELIKTQEPLTSSRLVVEHDIVQEINNKIIKKTVTTDVSYEHFKAIITLAVHNLPIEGACVTLYQPLYKGDTVKISQSALIKKFPNKTLKEIKSVIGLVVNIKNSVYSVMVLNETVNFERRDLINQRASNTKFIYKLFKDCADKANDIITSILDTEETETTPVESKTLPQKDKTKKK